MKTDADRDFIELNPITPTAEIVKELVEAKVATTSEKTVDGEIQTEIHITKFGEKWVLQSLRFGPQFGYMFGSLSADARFRAYFQLVEAINKAQDGRVIFKKSTKTGNPSEIHKGLSNSLEVISGWLEK